MNTENDSKAREKLTIARIGLLIRAPFFGNMATRLELTNADDWCSTAATDGRKFYYCSDFINSLSSSELEFLFAHEVFHVAFDHMGRFGTRDKRISNIAADYVVNANVIDERIGSQITKIKLLYDKKYDGWAYEEVYDHLMQNAEKIDIDSLVDRLLDEHMDQSDMSEEEKQALRDEVRENILAAAQSVGADNCPGGIKRLIKDLTDPKMNWRELLQQQIDSCMKADYSWLKFSRRAWHCDAILPGSIPGKKISLTIAIDTSGSITNEQVRDFFSEIYGIMGMYNEFTIMVWCFDTGIHNPQLITEDDADKLLTYEVKGGGGTSFQINWDYMKEHDIIPDKFIIFTDMASFDGFGDPDYCPTVFIAHGSDVVAPHGITCRY